MKYFLIKSLNVLRNAPLYYIKVVYFTDEMLWTYLSHLWVVFTYYIFF